MGGEGGPARLAVGAGTARAIGAANPFFWLMFLFPPLIIMIIIANYVALMIMYSYLILKVIARSPEVSQQSLLLVQSQRLNPAE